MLIGFSVLRQLSIVDVCFFVSFNSESWLSRSPFLALCCFGAAWSSCVSSNPPFLSSRATETNLELITGLLVCAKDADEDKFSNWGWIALPGWGVEAAGKQFIVHLHDGLQPTRARSKNAHVTQL